MFRHVSLLTLDDGAAAELVVAALRQLPGQVPSIRSYEVGADLKLAPGNATVAVVAGFDDEAGWRRYQDHPAHQQVLAELIRPVLAARTAAQYTTG